MPLGVVGHCAFTTTSVLFDCRWWEAFVFVTSWKPVSSERLPLP
jgi:hypothetical protein